MGEGWVKLAEIRRDRAGACHGKVECIGAAHGPPSGGVRPPRLKSRKLGGAGKCGSRMGCGANDRGVPGSEGKGVVLALVAESVHENGVRVSDDKATVGRPRMT